MKRLRSSGRVGFSPPSRRGGLKPTLPLVAALFAFPVSAAPWDAVIGNWRTTEINSCGIDDVRVGRILSVSETTIWHGFVICVISEGAAEGDAVTIEAQCDLGGGYETPLTYQWRLGDRDQAVLRLNDYDTDIVRCGVIE